MPDSAFDAWYNEIEGFALRAERLTGPKAELMAAFEAGVEAERERAARVAEEFFTERYVEFGNFSDRESGELVAASIRLPALSPSLKEQEEGN